MKSVWVIDDEWGYWDHAVFASYEAAVTYLTAAIDNDNSWNYKIEHYLREGDIVIQEVNVIE